MSKKKTHEEYVNELAIKNPNVRVVAQYVDSKTPILHHCLIHDVYWETVSTRVLSGAGCEQCRIEKFRKARCKTHEQYVKEVANINKDVVVIGVYLDAKMPIEHYCKKHDVSWMAYPDNILHGCGCYECGNEKIGDKNRKTHEDYIKEVAHINPDLEVIGQYTSANTRILHRCKLDGHEWLATPANILFGKGCPKCNDSHGEKRIAQWLDLHHIEYTTQKTFVNCKSKKLLPFDFYLPTYNVCIEYDGEQHFKPVDFFGGDEGYQQRQLHDAIKTKYCEDNNIRLLRIPYNQDVDQALESFLFI